MLGKKVPFYFVIIAFLLPASGLIFFMLDEKKSDSDTDFALRESSNSCNLKIKRLNGFQFIRPLLYAEPSCESDNLTQHKSEIETIINTNKSLGNITTASVYIREFSKAEWVTINENEKYSPGSLMKVPELIAFYKMNEKSPGLFSRKVKYDHEYITDKHPTYLSKQIKLGQTYTIGELLKYMIVYSDNNATILLNQIVDENIFKKVFSDVGLAEPDFKLSQYPITVNDFSIFMKELYNASYLSQEDSETCLEMLSRSDFRDGLLNGLPGNCAVAHKFGEGGTDNNPNFSESAIVYCGKKPYMITIMAKGTDMKKLPKVMSDISKKVYDIMSVRA